MSPIIQKNNLVSKRISKLTAVTMAIIFAWTNTVWAAPQLALTSPPLAPPGSEAEQLGEFIRSIDVPDSAGTVKTFFIPQKSPGTKSEPSNLVVIHIQDAHAQPEAQHHIQAILEHLAGQNKIQGIAVEGAFGEIQPKLLKIFPMPEINQQMGEFLIRKGELTGVEMFALKGENPSVPIRGADDRELYQKSYQLFKKVKSRQSEIRQILNAYNKEFHQLAMGIFNPDLQAYVFGKKQWDEKKNNLSDYFDLLKADAKKYLGIDLADGRAQFDWPNLSRIMKVGEKEKQLQADEARTEIKKLIEAIQKNDGNQSIEAKQNIQDEFIGGLKALAENQIPEWFVGANSRLAVSSLRRFFEILYRGCDELGISLLQYPEFLKLAGIAILRDEIDAAGLFEEVHKLEEVLEKEIVKTTGERKLLALSKDLSLFEKLLALSVTRNECEIYEGKRAALSPAKIRERFLELSDKKIKLPRLSVSARRDAEEFYRLSKARDERLLENAIAMAGSQTSSEKGAKPRAIVLITGGFHSDGVTRLLKEKNLAHIVISPKMTSLENEGLYEKVMLGEQADLGDLLAKNDLLVKQLLLQPVADYRAATVEPFGQPKLILRTVVEAGIPALRQSGLPESRIHEMLAASLAGAEIFRGARIRFDERNRLTGFDFPEAPPIEKNLLSVRSEARRDPDEIKETRTDQEAGGSPGQEKTSQIRKQSHGWLARLNRKLERYYVDRTFKKNINDKPTLRLLLRVIALGAWEKVLELAHPKATLLAIWRQARRLGIDFAILAVIVETLEDFIVGPLLMLKGYVWLGAIISTPWVHPCVIIFSSYLIVRFYIRRTLRKNLSKQDLETLRAQLNKPENVHEGGQITMALMKRYPNLIKFLNDALEANGRHLQDPSSIIHYGIDELYLKYLGIILKRRGIRGTEGERSFRLLTTRLNHEDPWVRAEAAEVLGMLAPSADFRTGTKAVTALIRRLQKEDQEIVRISITEALGQYGEPVIEVFNERLMAENTELSQRVSAAKALAEVFRQTQFDPGLPLTHDVKFSLELLRHYAEVRNEPNGEVRIAAIEALAQFSSNGLSAEIELEQNLNIKIFRRVLDQDPRQTAREYALWGLARKYFVELDSSRQNEFLRILGKGLTGRMNVAKLSERYLRHLYFKRLRIGPFLPGMFKRRIEANRQEAGRGPKSIVVLAIDDLVGDHAPSALLSKDPRVTAFDATARKHGHSVIYAGNFFKDRTNAPLDENGNIRIFQEFETVKFAETIDRLSKRKLARIPWLNFVNGLTTSWRTIIPDPEGCLLVLGTREEINALVRHAGIRDRFNWDIHSGDDPDLWERLEAISHDIAASDYELGMVPVLEQVDRREHIPQDKRVPEIDGHRIAGHKPVITVRKEKLLHPASIGLIFHGQNVLIQLNSDYRTSEKNVWDTSARGHVTELQTPRETTAVELKERIGITITPDALIRAGQTEIVRGDDQEVSVIYVGFTDTDVLSKPQIPDVRKVRWVPWKSLLKDAKAHPRKYSRIIQKILATPELVRQIESQLALRAGIESGEVPAVTARSEARLPARQVRRSAEEVTEARRVEFFKINRELLGLFSEYGDARRNQRTQEMEILLANVRAYADHLVPYLGEIRSADQEENTFLESLKLVTFEDRLALTEKLATETEKSQNASLFEAARKATQPQDRENIDRTLKELLKKQLTRLAKELEPRIESYTPLFFAAQNARDNAELDRLNREVVGLLKRRLKMQLLRLQMELQDEPYRRQGPLLMILHSILRIYKQIHYEHEKRSRRERGEAEIRKFQMGDATGQLVFNLFYEREPVLRVEQSASGVTRLWQIVWKYVEVEGGPRALMPVMTPMHFEEMDVALRSRIHALAHIEQDYTQLIYHDFALEDILEALQEYKSSPRKMPGELRQNIVTALQATWEGPRKADEEHGKLGLGRKTAFVKDPDNPKENLAMPGPSLTTAITHVEHNEISQAIDLIQSVRKYIKGRLKDIERNKQATTRKRDYVFLMIRDEALTRVLKELRTFLATPPADPAQLDPLIENFESIRETYFRFLVSERTYKELQRDVIGMISALKGLRTSIEKKWKVTGQLQGLDVKVGEMLVTLANLALERRSEVRTMYFYVNGDRELVIKHGDLAQEKADGVIVPLNTAFAVGGASASVLYTVAQAQAKVGGQNVYDLLFPSLKIKNPINLKPGEAILDLEDRPKVAEKGTAVISESIRATGIPLEQGWDRVIAAFIRDQGEKGALEETIPAAALAGMQAAEKSSLQSVAMVPFGTGIFGIPPKRAAAFMIPAILKYLREQHPSHIKKITIVMDDESQYEQFTAALRHLLLSEVQVPDQFPPLSAGLTIKKDYRAFGGMTLRRALEYFVTGERDRLKVVGVSVRGSTVDQRYDGSFDEIVNGPHANDVIGGKTFSVYFLRSEARLPDGQAREPEGEKPVSDFDYAAGLFGAENLMLGIAKEKSINTTSYIERLLNWFLTIYANGARLRNPVRKRLVENVLQRLFANKTIRKYVAPVVLAEYRIKASKIQGYKDTLGVLLDAWGKYAKQDRYVRTYLRGWLGRAPLELPIPEIAPDLKEKIRMLLKTGFPEAPEQEQDRTQIFTDAKIPRSPELSAQIAALEQVQTTLGRLMVRLNDLYLYAEGDLTAQGFALKAGEIYEQTWQKLETELKRKNIFSPAQWKWIDEEIRSIFSMVLGRIKENVAADEWPWSKVDEAAREAAWLKIMGIAYKAQTSNFFARSEARLPAFRGTSRFAHQWRARQVRAAHENKTSSPAQKYGGAYQALQNYLGADRPYREVRRTAIALTDKFLMPLPEATLSKVRSFLEWDLFSAPFAPQNISRMGTDGAFLMEATEHGQVALDIQLIKKLPTDDRYYFGIAQILASEPRLFIHVIVAGGDESAAEAQNLRFDMEYGSLSSRFKIQTVSIKTTGTLQKAIQKIIENISRIAKTAEGISVGPISELLANVTLSSPDKELMEQILLPVEWRVHDDTSRILPGVTIYRIGQESRLALKYLPAERIKELTRILESRVISASQDLLANQDLGLIEQLFSETYAERRFYEAA